MSVTQDAFVQLALVITIFKNATGADPSSSLENDMYTIRGNIDDFISVQ